MKNKLKLQNIIKHIKTMFYNLVSGQFKKSQIDTISVNEKKILRENDWYYQHSWFSTYFWCKLKRNIMNIIYKVFESIDDLLCEKYFVEIYFNTHEDKFHCYLPIIIQSRNNDEAKRVIGFINKQLTITYDCTIIEVSRLIKISKKEFIDQKMDISKHKLDGYSLGVLNIETLTPKLIQPNIISDNDYKIRRDKYNFRAIKNKTDLLWQNDNYFVQIKKVVSED